MLERRNQDGTVRQLTAEEISEFYKKFLNDNYVSLRDFNREWYKRNLSLLWPALRVKVKRFLRIL